MNMEKAIEIMTGAYKDEQWFDDLQKHRVYDLESGVMSHLAYHLMNSDILFVITEQAEIETKMDAVDYIRETRNGEEWYQAYKYLTKWYWSA